MAEGDTMLNAVIGAGVTILTTPIIPGAPVLGGVVSSYLQGRDVGEGAKIGAISGLLALIPVILLIVLFGGFFFSVFTSGGFGIAGGIGVTIFLFASVFSLLYVVLLSAIGGLLGAYINQKTNSGSSF